MSVDSTSNFEYGLIVETNKYTGNFERELCAFATGYIGECEVGEKQAALATKAFAEMGLDKYALDGYIGQMGDENGCRRPVSIWCAEGNSSYEDLIIFLEHPLTPKLFEIVKARIELYAQESGWDLDIKKIYMIKRKTTIVDSLQEPLEE